MPPGDISRLVRAIRDCFRDGLRIDARTVQQIDSALGPLSAQELARRLADAADCESSILVHLVFSPSRDVQMRLEPALGSEARSAEEIAALQGELLARGLRTALHFADGRAAVEIPVPPEGLAAFVDGLHLDRALPVPVSGAIDRHLPADVRPAVRVLLRNAGITGHRPVVGFLCRLLQHAAMLQPDLQECLSLAAELAATAGARTDLFARLEKLKAAHARRLRQALDSENALKRGNAESLMLSGRRIFQIDADEAVRRLACIDAVALAAFGRLPAAVGHVETMQIEGGRDAADALRRVGDLFR